jgi:hypothetical protein
MWAGEPASGSAPHWTTEPHLTLRPFIHFDALRTLWGEVSAHLFACGQPAFPAVSVEQIILIELPAEHDVRFTSGRGSVPFVVCLLLN